MENEARTVDDETLTKLADERRLAEHSRIDEEAGRHLTEVKYEMLKAAHEKLMAEHSERIQQLTWKVPGVLDRLICEAALGIPSELNFFRLTDEERSAVTRMFPDLPALILADLARQEDRQNGKEPPPVPDTNGFVRLTDWIARHVHFHKIPGWRFTSAEDSRIIYAFFDHHEDAFGLEIGNATQLVYNGIPLYEYDESAGQYLPIAFSHEDYIYLSKKGEHCDQGPTASFPYWAKKYYVKREHLDAHRIFFSGAEVGDGEQKIAPLRTALRHHIGFGGHTGASASSERRAHRTRMMDLVDRVIDHFYGPDSKFDPALRNWPKQEEVVPWLQTTIPGTSEAEAKAVDAVTRPDAARNKHSRPR
jgi:hypothetical protein